MPHRTRVFQSLLAATCVLALIPLSAAAYDTNYVRVVRLSFVEGDVQVMRADSSEWETGIVNLPLQQGYTVATNNGRAEIEFENGATARLAENSLLQFTELSTADGARVTKLTLTQGTATFYANLSREESFSVAAPQLQASIAGSARFRLDVSGSTAMVSVLKGDVQVDSAAGTNRISKGHRLVFDQNRPEELSVARNPEPDEWDRWVADRDDAIHTARSATQSYVGSSYTSSYNSGIADLYAYGSWYPVSGYGMCWRPYGVGLGWNPFWFGRWQIFPGLGMTWISFEPWGWLPFHSGRWAFSQMLGWVWVPGHFQRWQPAVVSWVRVGNRVGFVPLAPNDLPGQTPANLQHGLITASRDGMIRTGVALDPPGKPDEKAQVLATPPTSFASKMPTSNGFRGGAPSTGFVGENPDRPRGIVWDPHEHKFVNNPNGQPRSDSKVGDAHALSEPGASPASVTVTMPGARPAQNTPQPPPPRSFTSRPPMSPNPPARIESSPSPPRQVMPTPPPRVESPRPSSPPLARVNPPPPPSRPASPPPPRQSFSAPRAPSLPPAHASPPPRSSSGGRSPH